MIYLDNSATTYPKPDVVYEGINYASKHLAFNAGRGNYKEANEALKIIELTRQNVGGLVKVNKNNVVFLSSATEALNQIINGLQINENDNIYISPFEHNSIIRPLHNLQKKINFKIHIIPFNFEKWELKNEEMLNMFACYNPNYVFISHVSNVTGYILPYEKIFMASKSYKAINILDSAQAFGVLNPQIDNCDFIVFAGHKSLYASFGIAGFINVNDIVLDITKSGGNGSDSLNPEMPAHTYRRYESGTPNVIAIYSLLKSVEWLKQQNIYEHEKELVTYCLEKMKNNKKIKVYSPMAEKNLGIISFNVVGYTAEDVGVILSDEFDICVRTGYHCSPLVHNFIGTNEIGGTVRISFSAFNNYEEIDSLINALNTL